MQKLFAVISTIVALISATLSLLGAIDLLNGTDKATGTGVAVVLLAAAVAFLCGRYAVRGFRRAEVAQLARDERRILKLATKRGGSLTLAEITLDTGLSTSRAKQLLDVLGENRIATLRITDDGIPVYYFEGFLSLEQKSKARDLLEG